MPYEIFETEGFGKVIRNIEKSWIDYMISKKTSELPTWTS